MPGYPSIRIFAANAVGVQWRETDSLDAQLAGRPGERPRNGKLLHGDLSGVSELVADSEDGNTYRCVYTLRLKEAWEEYREYQRSQNAKNR